jgi:hypothetical protein
MSVVHRAEVSVLLQGPYPPFPSEQVLLSEILPLAALPAATGFKANPPHGFGAAQAATREFNKTIQKSFNCISGESHV